MADLVNGWLMSNVLDSAAEAIKRRKAEEKQNSLAQLAKEAMLLPQAERQNALANFVGEGGDLGSAKTLNDFGQQPEYTRDQIAANQQYFRQGITLFKSIPDGDPRKAQAYQQFLANMPDKRLASQIQANYPEYLPQMAPVIDELEKQLAGASSASNVQSRFQGRDGRWYALMRNGQTVPLSSPDGEPLIAPETVTMVATGDGYLPSGSRTGFAFGQQGASAPGTAPVPSAPPVAQAPRVTTAAEAYNVIGDEALQIIRQKLISAIDAGQVRREDADKELTAAMVSVANQMIGDANRGGGQPAPAAVARTPTAGPQTPAQAEAAAKAAKEAEEKAKASNDFLRQFQVRLDDMDMEMENAEYAMEGAIKLIDDGLATGLTGQVLNNFWGTDSATLSEKIVTLESISGLGKLEEMRAYAKEMGAASGASGLGQVTEKEMKLLKSAIVSVSQTQNDKQLKASINRFIAQLKKTREAVRAEYEAAIQSQNQPAGSQPTGKPSRPPAGSSPQEIIEYYKALRNGRP